jgi:hypothetical protein
MSGTQLTIFDALPDTENERLLGRHWQQCPWRHATHDPHGEPWPFQATDPPLSFAQVKAISEGVPA